jgi:hypothetical protein
MFNIPTDAFMHRHKFDTWKLAMIFGPVPIGSPQIPHDLLETVPPTNGIHTLHSVDTKLVRMVAGYGIQCSIVPKYE